jgi:hypothetical protein
VGAAGTVLFALAGLWFRQHATVEPDFAGVMLPSGLIAGAGIGLVLPTLSAAATGPLPPSRFATGTAVLGMMRQVGSALGIAVFVAILGRPTAATVIGDFRDVWTFMIACGLAAGLALLSMGPVRVGAPAEAARADAPALVAAGSG